MIIAFRLIEEQFINFVSVFFLLLRRNIYSAVVKSINLSGLFGSGSVAPLRLLPTNENCATEDCKMLITRFRTRLCGNGSVAATQWPVTACRQWLLCFNFIARCQKIRSDKCCSKTYYIYFFSSPNTFVHLVRCSRSMTHSLDCGLFIVSAHFLHNFHTFRDLYAAVECESHI